MGPSRPSSPSRSGPHALRYALVREVLGRYLSPIMVDSVLNQAMRARGVTPAMLSAGALAELTSDIMVGLRLFVPEERRAELMLDLAEVLDAEDR